ncbi:MAG: hypothetical protein HC860_25450 [Alkalinema sp. RU_4_3]|nr:hypothetical protein [Alkalinema sp. RU_4_3]
MVERGFGDRQLRFFTAEEALVLTPEESHERLAAKLRELGVDPDEVGSSGERSGS